MRKLLYASILTGLFLVTTSVMAQIQSGEDIAVTNTEAGKVRGFIHNGIYTYKGIPYAEAERFMPPVKTKPWEGVRSSMTWGPVAPLVNPTTSVNDEVEFVFNHDWGYTAEDCLRLSGPPGSMTEKRDRLCSGYTAGALRQDPARNSPHTTGKI